MQSPLQMLTGGARDLPDRHDVWTIVQDHVNGDLLGRPEAGEDMTFDFGQLVAHACRTRRLRAGSIVGSGANATVLHYVRNDRVLADAELESPEGDKYKWWGSPDVYRAPPEALASAGAPGSTTPSSLTTSGRNATW